MTIVGRLTTHSLEMISSLSHNISIGCVASSRTPPHCAKIAEKLFFAAALRNGDARSRLSGGAGVLPFTSLSAISVLCVVYIPYIPSTHIQSTCLFRRHASYICPSCKPRELCLLHCICCCCRRRGDGATACHLLHSHDLSFGFHPLYASLTKHQILQNE